MEFAIPMLKDVKGTRYRMGSDKYFETGLDFWIPKGDRTVGNVLSKT